MAARSKSLAMLTRGANPTLLTRAQIDQIVRTFDVEWD